MTVSITEVMRKLKVLQSQHRRELGKVQKTMKSGSGTEDIYKPTLRCYNLLSFQNDEDDANQSITNMDAAEKSSEEYSDYDVRDNIEVHSEKQFRTNIFIS